MLCAASRHLEIVADKRVSVLSPSGASAFLFKFVAVAAGVVTVSERVLAPFAVLDLDLDRGLDVDFEVAWRRNGRKRRVLTL